MTARLNDVSALVKVRDPALPPLLHQSGTTASGHSV
jgi:hypothetical protein